MVLSWQSVSGTPCSPHHGVLEYICVIYKSVVNTVIIAERDNYYEFTSSQEEIMIDKLENLIFSQLVSEMSACCSAGGVQCCGPTDVTNGWPITLLSVGFSTKKNISTNILTNGWVVLHAKGRQNVRQEGVDAKRLKTKQRDFCHATMTMRLDFSKAVLSDSHIHSRPNSQCNQVTWVQNVQSLPVFCVLLLRNSHRDKPTPFCRCPAPCITVLRFPSRSFQSFVFVITKRRTIQKSALFLAPLLTMSDEHS